MTTKEEFNKSRAKKAGKASGKVRRKNTKVRDKNICLAYDFLKQTYQTQKNRLKAFEYISSFKLPVKLQVDESPLTFLAERTGLSRQRIHQIIKKR